CLAGVSSSGLGGFFPYLASYSAANSASFSGWQTKHCESGRLCCLHQSPFALHSAEYLASHWPQIFSQTPCSLHHSPLWSWAFFSATGSGFFSGLASGVAVWLQPTISNAAAGITNTRQVANRTNFIVSSLDRDLLGKPGRGGRGPVPRSGPDPFGFLFPI